MMALIVGIATVFNIVVIMHKYRQWRLFDATLDLFILGCISSFFVVMLLSGKLFQTHIKNS